MVGYHCNTRHSPRAMRAPGRPYGRLGVFAAAFISALLWWASARAQVDTVRSDDGRLLAYTVARGWSRPLLTEIWVSSADGRDARRLKGYLGGSGGLSFLPGGGELLYLQRSLSHGAFGSNIYGGHELPLIGNRIWRLRSDGKGEALWPIPAGLHPLEAVASADGEHLAVRGRSGNLLDQREGELWIVGRGGRGRRLASEGVVGNLDWLGGNAAIAYTVRDSGRSRRSVVDVRTGGTSAVEDGATDPAGSRMPEGGGGDAAVLNGSAGSESLGRIGKALDQCIRGYHATQMERGRSAIRQAYRGAMEDFRKVYERHAGSLGISKADCQGYMDGVHALLKMQNAERDEWACQQAMFVVGELLTWHADVHGQVPGSLEALRDWTRRRIEGQEQETKTTESEFGIVDRDLRTLSELFRCSSDPFEERGLSYTYRPGAAKGDPVLACSWHRGRLLHIVGNPGSYRVEASDFLPGQLDSLDAAAADALAEGRFDRAVEILEVVAHQRHKDPVAHNKLGFAALKARDYLRAESVFREAASMSRGEVLARAYYGLGLIYVDRPKGRNTAVDYFRDALIRDRDFADARYQMAKARYEMWEYDAKSDIEKVLDIDPNYAPAYLLMGDYEAELNREPERAIPWYTKYLSLKPQDPDGRYRLSQAYLQVRDYDKVMQILLNFVQAHPEAIELLPIVAHASTKQDKLDLAMAFYRSYIDRQGADERALYEDITRFATPEEAAEYSETPSEEREGFLNRFWLARDPDLSTPVNERLLEHYRRVWYARQSFSAARQPWDVRGEVYVRYGEPDHRTTSLTLNALQSLDVQRVKERIAFDMYGAGGSGETFVGPVYPVRSVVLGGRSFDLGQTGEELEVLAEDVESEDLDMVGASDGGQVGASTGLSGEGDRQAGQSSTRAPDDDVPLTLDDMHKDFMRSTFSDRGETRLQFGEYRPVVASDVDVSTVPWESWVYTQVDGGIEITFTDESRTGDFGYAPVPMGFGVETRQLAKFSRYAPAAVARQAMAISPDFYAVEYEVEPFDFYFDQADFRGSNGQSLVEIYYGMPGRAARYVPEGNMMRMVVKRQAALVSTALDSVYRTSGDLVFMSPGNQIGAFVPDLVQLEVPPGTYRLEVRARDRLTGRLGLYRKELEVNDYTSDRLQLSSLELAWRIAEGMPLDKFSKKGLHVIPYPTRTYGTSHSVYVYYEVYNLQRDEFGQTNYRVEYTIRPMAGNVLSRLVRTIAGRQKEKVTVGYDQIGLGETETVWVELALGESRPGRHYLDVVVTDMNSGETTERETSFMVKE